MNFQLSSHQLSLGRRQKALVTIWRDPSHGCLGCGEHWHQNVSRKNLIVSILGSSRSLSQILNSCSTKAAILNIETNESAHVLVTLYEHYRWFSGIRISYFLASPQPFKNAKKILSWKAMQKQAAGQIWPIDHSLWTLGLTWEELTFSWWSFWRTAIQMETWRYMLPSSCHVPISAVTSKVAVGRGREEREEHTYSWLSWPRRNTHYTSLFTIHWPEPVSLF